MDQELEQIGTKLDAVLALLEQPAVPLADQPRDNADIGSYLRRILKVVRETLTPHPSFPKAIRLPCKGKARPLYKASEVITPRFRLGPKVGHVRKPGVCVCMTDSTASRYLPAQLSSAWPDKEKSGLAALVLRHF